MPLTEGFPWDDLRKIFCPCQRMAKVANAVKIAAIYNRLSRVHERYRPTDRRQTDGRATANSERSLKRQFFTFIFAVFLVNVKDI